MPIFRVSMQCHVVTDVDAPDFARAKQRAEKTLKWLADRPGVVVTGKEDEFDDKDHAVLYAHKDEPVQVMYMIDPATGDAVGPTQAEQFGMSHPAMQPKPAVGTAAGMLVGVDPAKPGDDRTVTHCHFPHERLAVACRYLNDDMDSHRAAGHDWHLDPGKLHAALEAVDQGYGVDGGADE